MAVGISRSRVDLAIRTRRRWPRRGLGKAVKKLLYFFDFEPKLFHKLLFRAVQIHIDRFHFDLQPVYECNRMKAISKPSYGLTGASPRRGSQAAKRLALSIASRSTAPLSWT